MFIRVYFALKLVVKWEGCSCMVIYTAICRTMSKSAKTAFIVWISTKRERFDVYMCTESKAKQMPKKKKSTPIEVQVVGKN